MQFIDFTAADTRIASLEIAEAIIAAFDGESTEEWRDIALNCYVVFRTTAELEQMSDELLVQLSVSIAYQFAKAFGGTQIYISNGAKLQARQVAERVCEDFTGNNIRDLVRKHSISEARIYQILKKSAAEKRAALKAVEKV